MSNKKTNKPTYGDDRVTIILTEYQALREELMYFINSQRKTTNIIASVAVGQIIFLLTGDKIDFGLISYIYLFLVPLVIFILMIYALEVTSKILLLADYIHKGIKPQLTSFFNNDDKFFEWEEHKGNTKRLPKKVLYVLDYSKWWFFAVGILMSAVFGIWFMFIANNILNFKLVIIALVLDSLWITISIVVAKSFNEIKGEARIGLQK